MFSVSGLYMLKPRKFLSLLSASKHADLPLYRAAYRVLCTSTWQASFGRALLYFVGVPDTVLHPSSYSVHQEAGRYLCVAITAFSFSNHIKFSWPVYYIHRITHLFLFFVLCSRLFYCIESSSSFIRAADSVSFPTFSIFTATAHHQRILWVCGRAALRMCNLDVIICFISMNKEKTSCQ